MDDGAIIDAPGSDHLLSLTLEPASGRMISVFDGREVVIDRPGSLAFTPAGSSRRSTMVHGVSRSIVAMIPEALVASAMDCASTAELRGAVATHNPKLAATLSGLVRARSSASHEAVTLLETMLARMTVGVFAALRSRPDDSWLPPAAIVRLVDATHRHISTIDVASLACTAGLSVSALSRAMRGSIGVTPGEYLIRSRVSLAARLLATTRLTWSEIAARTGMTPTHLRQTFRTRFGVLPADYRATSTTPADGGANG